MPRRTIIAVSAALALLLAAPALEAVKPPPRRSALAAEAPPAASNGSSTPAEAVVRVTPPAAHAARKILLFPLNLPAYALRAATLPIGLFVRFVERERLVERTANFLSNKKKTMWVYPIIEGGAGTGFGGGAALTHVDLFGRGYNLKLAYKNHIDLNQEASASFGKPEAFDLASRPTSWAGSVLWMRHTNEDFYGVGPSTTQADHAQFLINRTRLGAGLAGQILPSLSVNLGGAWDIATTGPNTEGSQPPANQLFPAAQTNGFGEWLNYAVFVLGAEWDTRDNLTLPEKGGRYAATISRFQHVGQGSFDFMQYELDGRHFFSLGFPRMVMALHGGALLQQPTGGGEVPFYRLATLDYTSPLRGFTRGRFHDQNLVVLNAEYRFPVWDGIDGVLFLDTGRVFHRLSDLTFDDFKYSAGGGLRARALGVMLLRFDLAYGGEGLNTMVGISKSL